MIQPISLYGDEVLRTPTTDFKVNEDISTIIDDMFETMSNASGVGLAAPQVGLSKRLFVIDIVGRAYKKVFINPKIISYTGSFVTTDEACLSLPAVSGPVARPETIEIEYYDENWKYIKETVSGLHARVIQHEYDHLEETLWIDRSTTATMQKVLSDIQRIIRREVKTPYPVL